MFYADRAGYVWHRTLTPRGRWTAITNRPRSSRPTEPMEKLRGLLLSADRRRWRGTYTIMGVTYAYARP